MKKLIVLVLCMFVFGVVSIMAENLESVVHDVSTGAADGNDYQDFGAFSLIIGSHVPMTLISRITLTSDDLSKAQTVTLWDGWTNGTSSAAVTKIWEWDLDSVTSVGPEIFQEYFGDGDRAYLKADYGLGATKSDSTGGITLSIQYK